MVRIVVAALAALPLAVFAQDPAGAAAPDETVPGADGAPAHGQGAYLGAGLGAAGFGALGSGAMARLRVGTTAPSGVGLGLEAARTLDSNDTVTLLDVAVTYPSGGSVFVRAAAGFAAYRWTGPEAYVANREQDGVNALVGFGGAAAVSSGLKFTVNLEGGFVRTSTTSRMLSAWFGLEWL